MPSVKFQTDAQRARLAKLVADLAYRRRVVAEVAEPLVQARDRVAAGLREAATELGVPESAGQFYVLSDGIHFAGPGQVWDPETTSFIDPDEAPEE